MPPDPFDPFGTDLDVRATVTQARKMQWSAADALEAVDAARLPIIKALEQDLARLHHDDVGAKIASQLGVGGAMEEFLDSCREHFAAQRRLGQAAEDGALETEDADREGKRMVESGVDEFASAAMTLDAAMADLDRQGVTSATELANPDELFGSLHEAQTGVAAFEAQHGDLLTPEMKDSVADSRRRIDEALRQAEDLL